MGKKKLERGSAFKPGEERAVRQAPATPVPVIEDEATPGGVVHHKMVPGTYEVVLIADIKDPELHDRIGYDESRIESLKQNIESVGGLIEPIIVRRLEHGTMERIAGFRRLEACKRLGWSTIEAKVLENVSDQQAALMMLSENIMREDINVYDSTVKIIEYVQVAFGISHDKLIGMLYRYRNFASKNIHTLTDDEQKYQTRINTLLQKTLNISLEALINRLRVLNINEKLIEKMKTGELQYSHAVLINVVVKKGLDLKELLAYTLKHKPSYNALRAHISSLQVSAEQGKAGGVADIKKVLEAKKMLTTRSLRKLSPDKIIQVEELLGQIKAIMELKADPRIDRVGR